MSKTETHRHCSVCGKTKERRAFIGYNDICRLCCFDIRDRSSPADTYKCTRSCLKCSEMFSSHMEKRICPKCKKGGS